MDPPSSLPDPAKGHRVDPLIDVAAALPTPMRSDAASSKRYIWISTWGIHDHFLLGPRGTGAPRLPDFCSQQLIANPDLEIFLLLWNFADWKSITGGKFTPALYDTGGTKRFHWVKQSNYPFGSHHEKFVLCDLPYAPDPDTPNDRATGDNPRSDRRRTPPRSHDSDAVLYCLGWNLLREYWDSAPHPNPNPNWSSGRRHWHDTGIRVQGPLISNFEAEFVRRWNLAGGAPALNPATKYFNNRPHSPGVAAQALIHPERTSPSTIQAFYLSSIKGAKSFVYLENQYLEDRKTVDAIATAYLAHESAINPAPNDPTTRAENFPVLVVLPWEPSPGYPTGQYTEFHVELLRALTAWRFTFPGGTTLDRPLGGWKDVTPEYTHGGDYRGMLCEDASGAKHLIPQNTSTVGGVRFYGLVSSSATAGREVIYVHSKLAMFDFEKYTLGSCNIASQSFETDSETNVAVVDVNEAQRLAGLLFPPMVDPALPAPTSPATTYAAFEGTARANEARTGNPPPPLAGLLLPYRTTM